MLKFSDGIKEANRAIALLIKGKGFFLLTLLTGGLPLLTTVLTAFLVNKASCASLLKDISILFGSHLFNTNIQVVAQQNTFMLLHALPMLFAYSISASFCTIKLMQILKAKLNKNNNNTYNTKNIFFFICLETFLGWFLLYLFTTAQGSSNHGISPIYILFILMALAWASLRSGFLLALIDAPISLAQALKTSINFFKNTWLAIITSTLWIMLVNGFLKLILGGLMILLTQKGIIFVLGLASIIISGYFLLPVVVLLALMTQALLYLKYRELKDKQTMSNNEQDSSESQQS